MIIQPESGSAEVNQHPLSGKEVRHRHPMFKGHVGTISGIRANAKDARERDAFVIEYGERRFLISRVEFEVI